MASKIIRAIFPAVFPAKPPPTLLDYFPQDHLLFIDESHVTVPQLHGMWHGDRSRKQNLVEYGYRLPSAMDNRPLRFEEFENRTNQVMYVSATPGPYELTQSGGVVVEQIIRPTGLVDPQVEVRPVQAARSMTCSQKFAIAPKKASASWSPR